jgi:hypothetical protein
VQDSQHGDLAILAERFSRSDAREQVRGQIYSVGAHMCFRTVSAFFYGIVIVFELFVFVVVALFSFRSLFQTKNFAVKIKILH